VLFWYCSDCAGTLSQSMFSGQAPSEGDLRLLPIDQSQLSVTGVIPAQRLECDAPRVMINSGESVPFTRPQILSNVVSLCSQLQQQSVESKVDGMLMLVGQMAQLLLLEQSSGIGSPLSWVTTSSSSGSSVVAAAGSVAPQPAAKTFKCPWCPSQKAPLTEKGFYKHVRAWKNNSKVCKRKPQCPGVLSSRLVSGTVDQFIGRTLTLLNPGANAAHGGGTGNHSNVAEYFSSVLRPM
jgi:hypothetical protein